MSEARTATWLVFGMGGGDHPPLAAARALARAEDVPPGAVQAVDNLCRRAVAGRAALPQALFDGGRLVLVARRPRAVAALLAFAGVVGIGREVRQIAATPVPEDALPEDAALPDPPDWTPWYPVIDAARCTRCGQCIQFCLFGVYARSAEGLPVVAHPAGCKNRCPACARICPGTAIVFPRHDESPIDGDVVHDEAAQAASRRQDVRRLLGDDPLAALRERQAQFQARRLVDPGKLRAALEERERHRPAADDGGPA